MKYLLVTVFSCLTCLTLCQSKSNNFDINYTLAYRDSVGFRISSKLVGESDSMRIMGVNGGGFVQTKLGHSSVRLVYDMYQLPGSSFYSSRYGLNFVNGGPNSSINFSLFFNDKFSGFSGLSGRLDLSTKFK